MFIIFVKGHFQMIVNQYIIFKVDKIKAKNQAFSCLSYMNYITG